jgi:PhnB protein
MPVSAIPAGYHTLTPFIHVKDSAAAISFYAKAFGAVETMRLTNPDGTIGHAEIQIGDSRIMMGDENPAWGNLAPETLGGVSGGLCLYVPDVDAAFERALAAGGTAKYPVADQFYGDRAGRITDPFGHTWMLATHIEDVPVGEMQKRMDEFMKKMAEG